jgi:hypothetical protein
MIFTIRTIGGDFLEVKSDTGSVHDIRSQIANEFGIMNAQVSLRIDNPEDLNKNILDDTMTVSPNDPLVCLISERDSFFYRIVIHDNKKGVDLKPRPPHRTLRNHQVNISDNSQPTVFEKTGLIERDEDSDAYDMLTDAIEFIDVIPDFGSQDYEVLAMNRFNKINQRLRPDEDDSYDFADYPNDGIAIHIFKTDEKIKRDNFKRRQNDRVELERVLKNTPQLYKNVGDHIKSFLYGSRRSSKKSSSRVKKSSSRVKKSSSRVKKSSSRVKKSVSRVKKSFSRVKKSFSRVKKSSSRVKKSTSRKSRKSRSRK